MLSDSNKYKRYRKRIEWEMKLLDTRTGVFLLANGLAATALQSNHHDLRVGLMLAALVVSIMWSVSSYLSTNVIYALKGKAIGDATDKEIEDDVNSVLAKGGWRSTRIIGYALPPFITFCWVVALFFHFYPC